MHRFFAAAAALTFGLATVPPVRAQPNAIETICASAAGSEPRLLEAGAEPRRALRFTPEAGTRELAEMRMAMATQVEVGGTVMPTPTPPTLVATVEYRVEQIAANGNITLSFVYTDVRAEPAAGQSPEMAAAFARAARNLVGIGGRLVSTPTGTISGLEVIVPPDLDPQLAQAMGTLQQTFEQVSFPLPSAPVGPQAQWQHCSTFDAGVLALDQAATYTVQSMRGDRVQLGIDIQQTADPQPFQLPGFPGSARLDALDSVGSGSVTLDLTRMAPQQLALETRSRQQISMTDPNAGRSEQIAVLSTVRLTVTAR